MPATHGRGMQVLRGNSYSYPAWSCAKARRRRDAQGLCARRESRPGAAEGLPRHEKLLLAEQQKLGRSRARRFSLETRRRRKLLEQKRKQWDRQEQQLRENILQRRRQQVQDATERFQRAHLPPSQRRRQSFRRTPPNVEDALNHIHGTLSSYTRQSSSLSRNLSIGRNCTPSPRPPTASKPPRGQALSAVEAYTKLLQEQFTCVQISQETQKTHAKQQDDSAQDKQLFYCRSSESLSSKDSLEIKEPDHSTKTLQSSYSSFLFDSERPCLDLRKQDDPSSDLTSFRAMRHLDYNSPITRQLREPKQKKGGDLEGFSDEKHVSKATWGFTSIERTPESETQPSLHKYSLFTLCEMISAQPEQFGGNLQQSSPVDPVPGNTVLESSCPKQETLLDLRQRRVRDDRQLKHPSAGDIVSAAKNGSSRDIFVGAPHPPNIFFNDSATDNTSPDEHPQQTGKENYVLTPQKELSASINNLNKLSNLDSDTEKPINAAVLQQTFLANVESDTPMCLKCPEGEVRKLPLSKASHPVHEVRVIKGILKKQSRHPSGDATCVYGSGHLIFAKQVALAIRDSVELTRAKTKEVEVKNTPKKKLRWFDEVHVEREDKRETPINQMRGRLSNLSQTKMNSEDHRLSPSRVPGASMIPSDTPVYCFTKQAWADVGVQVSFPQERRDEVKVQQCSARTGGPKVPQRECSARVGAGTVSSRIRKGIVMRPQSATKVGQIAKTQGKMMVPHPPPRMESTEEKPAHAIKFPKKALDAEDALYRGNTDGFFTPHTHQAIRTDSLARTPLYTCPVSEASARGKPSLRHQESHTCNRRRGTVHDEKGLCLDCTPTDDEISQLWHGVRSALATKDEKNALRSQDLESGRVGRKACVEQSRQPIGSRHKRPPQSSPAADPVRPNSKVYDMAFPDEGLRAAAQHPRPGVPAAPSEEKAFAVETLQTQRPGTARQHHAKEPASLSMEEQKILLSLDRLNGQLHCVHEHLRGAPDTRGLVEPTSTGEMKAANHHRHHRASSAIAHAQHRTAQALAPFDAVPSHLS